MAKPTDVIKQYKWASHLGEVAALVLLGNVVEVKRLNPYNNLRKQTQFGFNMTPKIEAQSKNYWDGLLEVKAMAYYEALNNLRKERYDFENGLIVSEEQDENITNLKN